MLPDILTNAGGVTVSYFEWVQDLGRLFWDRDEIRRRLADKLSDAFDRVWDVSQETRHLAARRRARRGDPRSLRRARGTRDLSVTTQVARDAMVPEPFTLEVTATASEAGEVLSRDAVRAVLVTTTDGSSVSSRARRSCVRSWRADARPGATTLGEIAEEPNATIDAAMPLDEAFTFLEQQDYERVPVVDGTRLRRRALPLGRAAPAGRGRAAGP